MLQLILIFAAPILFHIIFSISSSVILSSIIISIFIAAVNISLEYNSYWRPNNGFKSRSTHIINIINQKCIKIHIPKDFDISINYFISWFRFLPMLFSVILYIWLIIFKGFQYPLIESSLSAIYIFVFSSISILTWIIYKQTKASYYKDDKFGICTYNIDDMEFNNINNMEEEIVRMRIQFNNDHYTIWSTNTTRIKDKVLSHQI
jgi:hypothetical protein